MTAWAAYLCVAAAYLISAACAFNEARRSWSRAPRGRAWGAAAGLAFLTAAGALGVRFIALRAGYDNEHDFGLAALDFFKSGPGPLLLQKEVSPLALTALLERAAGFSLSGFIAGQGALWAWSCALIFAVLRRAGAGPRAAFAAAAFYGLNALAWMNAASVATTNANIFLLLCAVYALVALLEEPAAGRSGFYLSWFLASAFLVFTGRYEFFPVLLLGLALALWARGRRALAFSACAGPALLFVLAAGLYAWMLPRATHYNGPLAANLIQPGVWLLNLADQLGRQNLSPLLGLSPAWVAGLALAGLVLLGASAARGVSGVSHGTFWALFVGGWMVYFSAIYMAGMDLYPLHFMRHHLYFFLPVALLLGFVLQAAGGLLPKAFGAGPRWAAVALFMAAYAAMSVRRVEALGGQWRSNDREWRFLAAAQKDWPSGCRAYYGEEPAHRAVLFKYFPMLRPEDSLDSGCVLLYRSPREQVMRPAQGAEPSYGDLLRPSFGAPWREERFEHRYFTTWHFSGPRQEMSESTEALHVAVGFYRLPEAAQAGAAWALLRKADQGIRDTADKKFGAAEADFSAALALAPGEPGLRSKLLVDRGVAYFYDGRQGPALEDFRKAAELNPSSLKAQLSLVVALQGLGRPQEALARLDSAIAAIEGGPAVPGGGVWPDLLSTRGYQRLALGDRQGARLDFEQALKAAPDGWGRSAELERMLGGLK